MILIPGRTLAALTIWSEAEGEIYDGKLGVGEVIHKRIATGYDTDGSKSVAGCVCKSYQFSVYNDDGMDNRRLIKMLQLDDTDPVLQQCFRAWDESATTNTTNGAVLFCRKDLPPPWKDPVIETVTIGKHTFYIPAS